MTASPTLSSAAGAEGASAAAPLWLPEDLRLRIEDAAAYAGLSVAEVCEQWLLQGLEQAEHLRALAEAAGRCSLRTGTCTSGPVPLPVQQ
jgi:hypothetical protein